MRLDAGAEPVTATLEGNACWARTALELPTSGTAAVNISARPVAMHFNRFILFAPHST